jgi:hypothetical protein
MILNGYATGHGDTTADMLRELEVQARNRPYPKPVICIGEPTIAKLRNRETVELSDAILIHASALAAEPASGETTPDDDLSSGNRNKYTGRFRAPPPPPTQGEEP